jgi:hypothetical protein
MKKLLVALVTLAFGLPVAFADPSRAELEALLKETDKIAQSVSKLRGLQVKKPITRGIMSRPEITKRLLQRIEEDYPAVEILEEGRYLQRLGLLPRGSDYKGIVVGLLSDQIAGFYDPQSKELYLADWIETDGQRMIMAHEIDHALQDQTFDLIAFSKPIKDNDDAEIARQALVEGDGVALMIEFMFHEQGSKLDPWANDAVANMVGGAAATSGNDTFSKAPLFLRSSLMFPYQKGLKFVASVRKTQPWAAVDAVFRAPPVSSEQIIHPEKYVKGEKPIPIRGSQPAVLKGWKQTYFNVVGEMMFGVLFEQHGIAGERAARAAAGWGGDRIAAWAAPDDKGDVTSLVIASYSTWDAEADAVEAFDALADSLPGLSGAAVTEQGATLRAASGANESTFVERRGVNVLLVVGAPKDKREALRAELWSKWGR